MANPYRGEISAELDGKPRTLCLTLGALASLEQSFGADNLCELSQKFSQGTLRSSELTKLITAGLQGGGNTVSEDEVSRMHVDGGIAGYVEIAAQLLQATFNPNAANE